MKKELAIVCDGTEISFGINLLHLIKYEENDNTAKCKKYNGNLFRLSKCIKKKLENLS